MRIISQDGLNDYPYDSIMVWVDHVNPKRIGASMCSDPNSEFVLGTYNSEEDALYMMECIRHSKMKGYEYFFMRGADYTSVLRQTKEDGGEL